MLISGPQRGATIISVSVILQTGQPCQPHFVEVRFLGCLKHRAPIVLLLLLSPKSRSGLRSLTGAKKSSAKPLAGDGGVRWRYARSPSAALPSFLAFFVVPFETRFGKQRQGDKAVVEDFSGQACPACPVEALHAAAVAACSSRQCNSRTL